MGRKIKILYVDDEPDVRLIVALSLERHPDIDARAAASAQEAIQMLIAEKWEVDLLLIDVTMPVMTGPEMLAYVRQNPALAHIPVAFVTAKARPKDIEEYRALGAVGVIEKPFDALTFAEKVMTFLAPAHAGPDKG